MCQKTETLPVGLVVRLELSRRPGCKDRQPMSQYTWCKTEAELINITEAGFNEEHAIIIAPLLPVKGDEKCKIQLQYSCLHKIPEISNHLTPEQLIGNKCGFLALSIMTTDWQFVHALDWLGTIEDASSFIKEHQQYADRIIIILGLNTPFHLLYAAHTNGKIVELFAHKDLAKPKHE